MRLIDADALLEDAAKDLHDAAENEIEHDFAQVVYDWLVQVIEKRPEIKLS